MADRPIDQAALEFACGEAFASVDRDWKRLNKKERENVLAQAEVFVIAYEGETNKAAGHAAS